MESRNFEAKVHEAWTSVTDISLFNYSLLFITVFLVFVLVFALLDVWIYLSLLPAGATVLASYLLKRRGERPLQTLEMGNPALRDRLSAAYDNKGKGNIVVKELIRDTSYYLDDLRTDAFFDVRKTEAYIAVSIIVVFILLSLMFFGPGGFGLPGLFGGDGSSGSEGTSSGNSENSGSIEGSSDIPQTEDVTLGTGPPQDIYGTPSIAKIEGKDMDLEMHPEYGEEGGVGSNLDTGQSASQVASGTVQSTAAEAYRETIPVELEGAIRQYFEKLAEE